MIRVWWITLPRGRAKLRLKDGRCVQAAEALGWCVNKSERYLEAWFRRYRCPVFRMAEQAA